MKNEKKKRKKNPSKTFFLKRGKNVSSLNTTQTHRKTRTFTVTGISATHTDLWHSKIAQEFF